jgi:hypothetical protein
MEKMTTEEQLIALGFRPRTLHGWWFWLREWSPLAFSWRWVRGYFTAGGRKSSTNS